MESYSEGEIHRRAERKAREKGFCLDCKQRPVMPGYLICEVCSKLPCYNTPPEPWEEEGGYRTGMR